MKRRPACRVTPAPLYMPVPGSAKHLFVCLCDWAAWPGASHICPKSNAVDAGPTPCPSCRGVAALPSSREGAWPSLEHGVALSHSPARLRKMKSPWAVAVWGQTWAPQQLAVPVLHPRWPPLRAVIFAAYQQLPLVFLLNCCKYPRDLGWDPGTATTPCSTGPAAALLSGTSPGQCFPDPATRCCTGIRKL